MDDISGGTATLSNVPALIGGTYTSPVLVDTELCIGAVGKIRKVPRVERGEADGDQIVIRQVMTVSWSADHRVIDGATLARFSEVWRSFLGKPALLAALLK